MRLLVLPCVLLGLAGCDPVWHVTNVATAQPATKADAACIEAGVRAAGYDVQPSTSVAAPVVGWRVSDKARGRVHVMWDPKTPQSLTLDIGGVGTAPPPDLVPAFRQMRDAIVAKVTETCGPFDVGAESCARVADCKVAATH